MPPWSQHFGFSCTTVLSLGLYIYIYSLILPAVSFASEPWPRKDLTSWCNRNSVRHYFEASNSEHKVKMNFSPNLKFNLK